MHYNISCWYFIIYQSQTTFLDILLELKYNFQFPLGFVQEYCETHFPQARIYDVYGVTEVSCWATVFEVTKRFTFYSFNTLTTACFPFILSVGVLERFNRLLAHCYLMVVDSLSPEKP